MVKITLDSSCFECESKELDELIEMSINSDTEIQISSTTMEELVQTPVEKLMKFVEHLTVIDIECLQNSEEFDKISDMVLEIHSSQATDKGLLKNPVSSGGILNVAKKYKNTYNDADIFSFHIITRGDIFVTKDKKGFISNGKKEVLEKQFRTKIRFLDKILIEEMKYLT